ncbi:hypothetical protein MuYL_3393 [Mucilaginibacter xinganensis]|uniref:Uncharacterized protein n=2 Tax=Mucilaginibacter xinganensis TaxID=1234841 RepID=A0A223P0D1_9SPHI|nr:hypothetical protein MuYL_3393 [Mucilaginibacter xinganensis]
MLDIDKLKRNSNKSKFQSWILDNIEMLLNQIDENTLSNESSVEADGQLMTIYLVHKMDSDTIVILNILKDHVSLWVGENNLYFDINSDINYFKDIYLNCLKGDYETTEYFFKDKLIFSITYLLKYNDVQFIKSHTFFYPFYKWLYKGKFILKHSKYKSFINK